MNTGNRVKVWDPLVRIFHWTLVAAFTIAYFTDDEELLLPHVWAGYAIIGLLLFRLLWGFLGTIHARFSDFVYAPSVAIAFVKDTFKRQSKRYLGHNPAGGWMIILLLIMLTLISITGVLLYGADEHAGPLAGVMAGAGKDVEEMLEGLHEFCANFTVFLVAIHLTGVIMESVLHKENLVRAMVTGWKRSEGEDLDAAKTGAKGAAVVGGIFAMVLAAFAVGMMGGDPVRAEAGEVRAVQGTDQLLPLEAIIAKAKKRHDGQLIEAELKSLDGRDVYEIEILDEEGKVWETYFDAKTGDVMTLIQENNGANTSR